MKINWTKELLEEVVSKSRSQPEVIRSLGLRAAGGNFKTLQKYLDLYQVDTSHFIKNYDKIVVLNLDNKKKLNEILVENSTFSRSHLKERLYKEGIKERKCEMCGQDENWNGSHMSLILDHINGVHNDNRLENLRIVCPNCNATLETHCNGTHLKKRFYCDCGNEIVKGSKKCSTCNKKDYRKVERPTYDELKNLVKRLGYSGTGREYGVSDNAVRKWIKSYEK